MRENIIANVIGRLWSILSNFIFIPVYIYLLGFESYSIISFTLVITGLMAVLDFGLTATLSREFSRVDKSFDEKIRSFKTLEILYFVIVLMCIILIFSLSGAIARYWLKLASFDPEMIAYYLKITSFDVSFQLLIRFYTGGLLGLQKQVKANIFLIGWGLLRNGFVIAAIFFAPVLGVFFIWQSASTVIVAIFLRLYLYKTLIGRYLNFELIFEKVELKRIWHFAGGMLLISLVASLNTQMDKLAISKFLPIESLGYYTLAVSLGMGVMVLVSPISVALLPHFTALYSAGKNDEAAVLFQKIYIFLAILVFTVMANMIFFAKELIWIWTANMDLAEHAFIYLPIVAVSFAMLALATIPYTIAIANGYTKLNNILGIISLFVTMPGYWIVTKYYGAIGAAYIFCSVQTITTIIYFYIITKRFIKIEYIGTIFITQFLFPMVVTLTIAFCLHFILVFIGQSRILLLVYIGLSTISTFLFSLFVLLTKSEIKNIFNVISKRKLA